MSNEAELKAKAAAKVAKLSAMAAGKANEHEANQAMAMAAAISAEFGLTQDDIDAGSVAANDFVASGNLYSGSYVNEKAVYCMVDQYLSKALCDFCAVTIGTRRTGNDAEVEFFGHRIDVEIAKALRIVINKAMNMEWVIYRDFVASKFKSEATTRQAEMSFSIAMAGRLRERMQLLRKIEGDEVPATNALVVSKAGLLKDRTAVARFVEARYSSGSRYTHDRNAGAAGNAAGGRVGLHSGNIANGSGGVKAIAR